MEKPDEAAEQLLEGALELSPHERQAFLDRTCSGQPALRKIVEALLEENDRLTGFLSPPLRNFAARSADPASSQALPNGAQLGTTWLSSRWDQVAWAKYSVPWTRTSIATWL